MRGLEKRNWKETLIRIVSSRKKETRGETILFPEKEGINILLTVLYIHCECGRKQSAWIAVREVKVRCLAKGKANQH